MLVGVQAPLSASAPARESLRIAAIVNDNVISGFDLFTRMRLIMLLSNIQDNQESRRRLAPQILRRLIDERLQSEEIERMSISIPDADIQAAIRSIEKSNGIPRNGIGDFLARNGIPETSLASEVETRLGWEEAIGRQYGRRIVVADEEVRDIYNGLVANTGKPEYLVAEIFLAIDQPSQREQVGTLAGRIIQQIRGGAPFSALASNFSQSPTAAVGGDLGWLQSQQLDPEIARRIETMTPRSLSEPIETVSGIYILALRDKRISQGPVDPMATVNLQQLFFPVGAGADPDNIQRTKAMAENFRARSTSCQAMEAMKGATGSSASGNMGNLRPMGLTSVIRDALVGLPGQTPSPVIRTPKGFSIVMICSRSSGEGAEGRILKGIRQKLLSKRLENAARRHIRQLRRNAFIDVRL